MEDWYLIANPVAGGNKCRDSLSGILAILNYYGIKYKKAISRRKADVFCLTKEAIKAGYRKFIGIGGDGTANEIVNGINYYKEINPIDYILGLIPMGTGNDWQRSLGLPADHEEIIRLIKKENTSIQDICRTTLKKKDGTFHERYFINVAGAGYDAEVLFKTERMKEKGKRGKWLYFYNIFTSLLSYKPILTTVKIDGKEVIREKALSMNIGIGKYNGGGLMQVPHAVLDDGHIAFTFIGDIGKFGILFNVSRLKSGKIENINKVQLLKGKKIEINTNARMLFEADGEAMGETPLTFQVIPKSLRMISGLNHI